MHVCDRSSFRARRVVATVATNGSKIIILGLVTDSGSTSGLKGFGLR